MIKVYINSAEIRHWVAPTLSNKTLTSKFIKYFSLKLRSLDFSYVTEDFKLRDNLNKESAAQIIQKRVSKKYQTVLANIEKQENHFKKENSIEKTINNFLLENKLENWREIFVRFGQGTMINLARNLDAEIIFDFQNVNDSDLVIIRNIGDETSDFIKYRLSLHDPKLIFIDVAYYTPYKNKSIQRVGINSFVHSNYRKCDDSRLWMFDGCLQDWKNWNGPILLIPPEGFTCEMYKIETTAWVHQVVTEINKHYKNKEIVIRYKPNKKLRDQDSLEDQCNNLQVSAVVTHSSTAALQTLMWGIPSISTEKCPISAYFDGIEKIANWEKKDRLEFLKWLSHCQYTVDEIESGEAILRVLKDNIS